METHNAAVSASAAVPGTADTLSPDTGSVRRNSPSLIRTRISEWAVRGIAFCVALLGLSNLWSALLARGPGRAVWLHETAHMPLVLEHASRTLIALFGLALLTLARSLARHKRQAWWLALFLSLSTPLPHLVKGLDYEEAIISLIFAAVLIVFRHSFYAENDRPSARQGIAAALGLFLFAFIYGPVGYYLLRDRFQPTFTWERAFRQTTHQIFYTPPVRSLVAKKKAYRALWFDESLLTISVFSFAYGGFMLLRPVLPRERHSPQAQARAQALLQIWGGDPVDYFALLPDKRYLFDDSTLQPADWGIAYVVVGATAVTLGDPFGDPARAGEAIHAFVEHCRRHDWQPAFYQVTDRCLPIYRTARLRALKVGEDALLDLTTWSLKGKAFQDLRTAINKMGRLEIAFEDFDAESPDDASTLAQMNEISEAWLHAHKGEEKTFALGRFAPESDTFRDSRIFLARETQTGRVLAFVTFVPIFGPGAAEASTEVIETDAPTEGIRGWGLDLMRRRSDSPNGLMEFLIASSALRFQSEGAQVMSLGLSPLYGGDCPDPAESEMVRRGRQLLYERFNHFYAFKGLHAYKEKFGPRWEARYLIYPGEANLGQTIYAVIRAHSPRGLWTFIAR